MMTCMFCIVLKKNHDQKTVVLRKKIDETEILEIIEEKKTAFLNLYYHAQKKVIFIFTL